MLWRAVLFLSSPLVVPAILAFAAGRGLHGLMAIVPMVVGAAIGAGVLGASPPWRARSPCS